MREPARCLQAPPTDAHGPGRLARTPLGALILRAKGLIEPAIDGTPQDGDYLVGGMMPVTIIFALSTLALVSLVTKPPPAEHVEEFMIPRSGGI